MHIYVRMTHTHAHAQAHAIVHVYTGFFFRPLHTIYDVWIYAVKNKLSFKDDNFPNALM